MIKFKLKIPLDVTVACSGGVDSMAVLHFLSQRKTRPRVAYMHHGTEHGEEAYQFVKQYCADNNLELSVGNLLRDRQRDESPEEFWRIQRYAFLHGIPGTVVMAHHLDDNMESWLLSALHGKPSVMPIRNRNVIRPFMMTKKSELMDWCCRHSVPYVHDKSNEDTKYARNRIRNNIIPEALAVNPGLHKVVGKLVAAQYAKEAESGSVLPA
jgi:tRNA(Ile)-lysidine synthase